MRRVFLAIAILCTVAVGCGKDEITTGSVSDSTGGVVDIDTTGSGSASLDGYDRSVSVVFSVSGAATVSGDSAGISAEIVGNGVTITNASGSKVAYFLSGTTTDGFLKIYSGQEQALVFNSANIANSNGSAINIQGSTENSGNGMATRIVLNGSSSIADGGSYSNTPLLEDEKAALFAEGGLALSGTGSLTVTATGKGGITSDSHVRISGTPTINITATNGHGIRGKSHILVSGGDIGIQVSGEMKKGMTSDTLVRVDGGTIAIGVSGGSGYDTETATYGGTAGVRAGVSFIMNGGSLWISNSGAGGKGINSDGSGLFNGGTVDITVSGADFNTATDTVASKGIKFQGNIAVAGGTVTVRCSHNEAVESKGNITITAGELYGYSATSNAVNARGNITLSGGYLCGHSDGNDGLDAGGNITIGNGLVFAISTDGVHKAINSGKGYTYALQSGTMIAIGALENGASLTPTCQQASSWSRNTWHALTAGGSTYAFKTPTAGGGAMLVAGGGTLALTAGVTTQGGNSHFNATLVEGGNVEGGSAVALQAYTSAQ